MAAASGDVADDEPEKPVPPTAVTQGDDAGQLGNSLPLNVFCDVCDVRDVCDFGSVVGCGHLKRQRLEWKEGARRQRREAWLETQRVRAQGRAQSDLKPPLDARAWLMPSEHHYLNGDQMCACIWWSQYRTYLNLRYTPSRRRRKQQ